MLSGREGKLQGVQQKKKNNKLRYCVKPASSFTSLGLTTVPKLTKLYKYYKNTRGKNDMVFTT